MLQAAIRIPPKATAYKTVTALGNNGVAKNKANCVVK